MDKVTIEAERIGLPATATAADIVQGVYSMHDRLKKAEAEVATWKGRAEENQALAMQYKQGSEKSKVLEAQLFVESLRAADKIDESEKKFYTELYLKDQKLCEERAASLKEREYLRKQESLRGTVSDAPADAEVELSVLVAEVMANDKNLTQAQAVKRAYASNKGLFERVRESKRAKAEQSAAKGGA